MKLNNRSICNKTFMAYLLKLTRSKQSTGLMQYKILFLLNKKY